MQYIQTEITDSDGILIGSGCVPEGFLVWGNRVQTFQSNERPFKLGLNAEQQSGADGSAGAVFTADTGEFFTDARLRPEFVSTSGDGRPQRMFVSVEEYLDTCAAELLGDRPREFLSQEYLDGTVEDVKRAERMELLRARLAMRSAGGTVLPFAVLKRAPVRYYQCSDANGVSWLMALGALMRGTEVVMYAQPASEAAFPAERVFGQAPLAGAVASTIHWQAHMRFCCSFPIGRWGVDEAREAARTWGQSIAFSSALMQEMQTWTRELNALANQQLQGQVERLQAAHDAAVKEHEHHHHGHHHHHDHHHEDEA